MAADKGYHKNETLAQAAACGMRTYIPEPNSPYDCVWTDKPEEVERAVVNNRRRKGKDRNSAGMAFHWQPVRKTYGTPSATF